MKKLTNWRPFSVAGLLLVTAGSAMIGTAAQAQALAAPTISVGQAPFGVVITPDGSTGTLPAGLSFDASTGVISGTPTTIGAYHFTVTAANSIGAASRDFLLVVGELAPAAVSVVPTADPTAIPSADPMAVPTAVDAGYAGGPSTDDRPGLVLAGGVLLGSALMTPLLLTTRRRRRRRPSSC